MRGWLLKWIQIKEPGFALDLLDAYDQQAVSLPKGTRMPIKAVTVEEARKSIGRLRKYFNASPLFGRERDDTLTGILNGILQTFNGHELYPSLEEKAAHLLYFLVKNHPFVDGNKRIAATLFLWFLQKNTALYLSDNIKRIDDKALVATTLLIAESRPEEKDLLTRVLVHLIHPEKF